MSRQAQAAKVPVAPPPDAKLLTVPEVAYEIRLSVDTVYRMINCGDLESTRIGSRRFVTRKTLSDFIEGKTCRTRPGSASHVKPSVGLKESGMWSGKDY